MRKNEKHYEVDHELQRNGSGYIDPTAYEAITNVEKSITRYEENRIYKFHRLLNIFYKICELCDFEIVEHVVVRDKITGKVWK